MSKPSNYYTIFCGVFLYEKRSEAYNDTWQSWAVRLKDASALKKHLIKNYYETYLSAVAPEQLEEDANLLHFTNAKFSKTPVGIVFKEIELQCSFFDVYLFGEGIGLYAFKVSFPIGSNGSYPEISTILNYFRNTDNLISFNEKEQSINKFIELSLEGIELKSSWNKYTPHPKAYTIITEKDSEIFNADHDVKLFELANSIPYRSYGKSTFAPTSSFYDELFKSNCISVFNNWKALTLFDSFTRLNVASLDTFQTWELEYFNIYILSLYTKFKLYYFNSELKDVARVSRKSYELKNQFIEFVNDYNLSYISYKFLPNLLYNQIRSSLEIQKEIDQIEIKVHRLSEAYLNKKSSQLNRFIIFLSLLSVISVFADVSDWLTKFGVSTSFIYSFQWALLFFGVPAILIGIFSNRFSFKKKA